MLKFVDFWCHYPAPHLGTGYCFRSISLFLCQQDYEKTAGPIFLSTVMRANCWTDLHAIFREGVEWPWDDLITFLVNSEKPRDAAMCNTGAGFVVPSHHSLSRSVSTPRRRRITWRKYIWHIFTVRRYALHGLCDRNSVRLSVRLSHSCTVSTWFDLRSWFLHHVVAASF